MQVGTALCVIIVVMASSLTEGHRTTPSSPLRYERYKRFLCSYWYNWPWVLKVERTEPTERLSQMRTLVGTCEVDVGTCPVGSCSTFRKFSEFCPDDGYICAETETRIKDCGQFGGISYEYVKQCGCCKDTGIVVTGIVKDQATNEPVGRTLVFFDIHRRPAVTGVNGMFRTTIESSVRRVVIRTKNRNYLEAVKVVDIPEGFRGPVEVELFVIRKSNPVKFDSTVNTVLSLSNNPLDPEAGHTVVEIQANSFINRQGKPYQGTVIARITFIDTENNPDNVAPGVFQTAVENSVEPLITDGVVSFSFENADGKDIKLSAPVKFTGREGMRVWKLNSFTGLWELVKPSQTRGKRQVSLDDILSIETDRWYNIDKIPGAPRCYFKGRIFDELSGIEITSSSTASFRPEITAYTSIGQRLRLYAGYTTEPSTTCYEVRCPIVSNPDDNLAGFINMSSTEVVTIGGINFPLITYLTPKELADYDAAVIQPKLSDVQYDIAPNELDIFVNFVSDIAGPFYRNKNICENSSISQPAFHFFKPELPTYEPVPDDTEICTARITFKDRYNFYNYISNVTNMPNVTGISVWGQDGTNFYYTDVAQMELYTDGNTTFVFICLKYRCSQENDLTTVYIDIEIPVVNVTYNRTFPNGTVVNYTYEQQDFGCHGNHAKESEVNGGDGIATIEGSFTAPVNVGTGPDFYNTEFNDCKQETNSTSFAYELFCYSKRGGQEA
ncbi:cartilage intermediate layer protein 2-like [Ruditapes philippinarum]|uniref:cartilage intermediate layer protein 2-like n=1 Tax=Ruditapes philippinarum TaxID=129788 RepID=UPI00295A5B87|nr:cartilage intermediate layer protein 2-like [Ruditapes philippinarum]